MTHINYMTYKVPLEPTVDLESSQWFYGPTVMLICLGIGYGCFMLQQSGVVLTETGWPARPRMFTVCPLQKKCVHPCRSSTPTI